MSDSSAVQVMALGQMYFYLIESHLVLYREDILGLRKCEKNWVLEARHIRPGHLLSPQFALGAKDAAQSGEGLASMSEEGLQSEALYELATVAHACYPSTQKTEAGGWEIKAMPGYIEGLGYKRQSEGEGYDPLWQALNLHSHQRCDLPAQLLASSHLSLDPPLSCSLPVSSYKVKRLALQASFEIISSRGCHSLS